MSPQDSGSRRLRVTDEPRPDDDKSISFATLRSSVSEEAYDEAIEFFFELAYETRERRPTFLALWGHLLYGEREGLLELLLVSRALRAAIEQCSIETVECEGLTDHRRALVRDVCEELDVAVVDTRSFGQYFRLFGGDVLRLLVLFCAQFVASVRNAIAGRPDLSGTVFFPYPGREDSMLPVLSRTRGSFRTVVHTHRLIARFAGRTAPDPQVRQYNPSSYVRLSTFSAMVAELSNLWDILTRQRRRDVRWLAEKIDEQYDVSMRHSVEAAYLNALSGNLRGVGCFSAVVESALADEESPDVVIGGFHARSRAISHAAHRSGADIYYVPHSIEKRHEQPFPAPMTVFVSGNPGREHLSRTHGRSRNTRLIPCGRPYLQQMVEDHDPTADNEPPAEPVTVLLATQDKGDPIREQFFRLATAGLDSLSGVKFHVVVKPHPSESAMFYDDLVAEARSRLGTDVTVEQSDLHEAIQQADAVVTINSNVGLEAMILGTSFISINPFTPFEESHPFIRQGPTPELASEDDVRTYFESLTTDSLHELGLEQHAFATTNFVSQFDTAECIRSEIAGMP